MEELLYCLYRGGTAQGRPTSALSEPYGLHTRTTPSPPHPLVPLPFPPVSECRKQEQCAIYVRSRSQVPGAGAGAMSLHI